MSLLPKTKQDFAQKEYWNSFFQKRGNKSFEWYGEYLELCGYLHKYIKQKDNILVVGCGNSKLSMDLYDVGCKQLVNIDISHLVINQMIELNRQKRPDMQYIQMDATAMTFKSEEFSVALDKGTLDALMPDDTVKVVQIIEKYFQEISRILKNGGRYICISLLQEHIIQALVEFFPKNNFLFRVVRCEEVERKTAETSVDGTAMPVFMIIATKFEKLPFPVLEICMSGGDKMERLKMVNEIIENVLAVQKVALICNGLHRGSIADVNEVSMDLYRSGENMPRFTVHVIDQKPQHSNGKYAIFIVPQGREIDWLFSTPEGRRKLCNSSQHNRLAIVSMHRGQVYKSWKDVKLELAESMKNLAPKNLTEQIPYLSLGSEVGKRDILFSGHSDISGDYIIEEFTGEDGKIFRRLVFLSSQFVVQSEALVKMVKNKKTKTMDKQIDPNYLACQHHLYMAVGVNVMAHSNKTQTDLIEIVVIGLGGGGLCTFLHRNLKNVRITAVDIDPAMLLLAKKYFGLTLDKRLDVVIDDGIQFINNAAKSGRKFDAILFDVDSKDPSIGMSCPPANFLDPSVLESIKTCISDNGVFILNLVCRNDTLRTDVLKDLGTIFQSLCSYKLEEDVNEILYLRNKHFKNVTELKKEMEIAVSGLNILQQTSKRDDVDLIDVEEFLSQLKI